MTPPLPVMDYNMSDFHLVDANASTLAQSFLKLGNKMAEIVRKQETGHIQEYAKALRKETYHGQMIGNTQRHMEHVAEIPITVYHHLMATYGPAHQNPKAWRKWLNEHPDFKTSVREL